jgi:hypothetical protein
MAFLEMSLRCLNARTTRPKGIDQQTKTEQCQPKTFFKVNFKTPPKSILDSAYGGFAIVKEE